MTVPDPVVVVTQEIRDSLSQLDGSRAALVSIVTGLTRAELDDLGGVPEAMSDWSVDPKPVPEELEPEFTPTRTTFGLLSERLDGATIEQMFAMARGGIGDPESEAQQVVRMLDDNTI